MNPTVKKAQKLLTAIAWPLDADGEFGPQTRAALKKFQRGYARSILADDGRLDDRTMDALVWSADNYGRCSEHFRFVEFKSKGNGDVVLLRELVLVLEKLRKKKGRPIRIVSGYRDPFHNDVTVKGAKFSQHKYGAAADLEEDVKVTIAEATEAGATGIGYDDDNGFVEHVDVRHAGPNNTTGARPGNPSKWPYS